MQSYFKNKTIVISGVARGIGKALAIQAAKMGMHISGLDLRQAELDDLALMLEALNAQYHLEVLDIRNEAACKVFIQTTRKKLGAIDILINNAGITHIAPEHETSIAETKNLMDINFMGMVHLSHFALPDIVNEEGTIAGISSVAGYSPLIYRTTYAASKHAVFGYLASLRAELRDKNVQVLTICPSFVVTDLQENQQQYFKNNTSEALTPEFVAKEIFEAIWKRNDLSLIGKTAKRVYCLNRFFPRIYEKIMLRKMKI
jgi:short-subunit dehydrogenase